MRALDLDGAVLLFDRDTGQNVLVRGEETADRRQTAPRVVQMALTNACNKTCGFCYRPMEAKSAWSFDDVMAFGKMLSDWGVLELALGGGEPTVFPRFAELVRGLWSSTRLAVNFTTNGTRLTGELLDAIQGSIGQLQVSVYDDEDTNGVIDRLVARDVRFGLNYLVTPQRLRTLDADLLAWAARGVRDVLLLSYKGDDDVHLSRAELAALDASLIRCHEHFEGRLQLKVDVCWSSRLPHAPQLFFDDDCRAGSLFLSVTSDKRVLSCSFASRAKQGIELTSFDDLPAIYARLKAERRAADVPGCARNVDFGLSKAPRKGRRRLPQFVEIR